MHFGEKAKNFKGTIRRLIDYLKPYRIAVILTLICAVGSACFTIFTPKNPGQCHNEDI
jgi:ATP-binding cassette subfamily B protein